MLTEEKRIVGTALWQPDASRKIRKRIVITGTLALETPAHFGTGEQAGSELLILEDALENKPLLPGASIAGALRHHLIEREFGYRNNPDVTDYTIAGQLFGIALDTHDGNDRGNQSRILIDDALGEGKRTIRDGVKIDGKTRTAEDKALYSTQVWEVGTTFDLRFELCIYDSDREDKATRLIQGLAVALDALGSGQIPMGARKHRGYGRASVNNWHVQTYDFTKTDALDAWLTGKTLSHDTTFFANINGFVDQRTYVQLAASFNLCHSLLIRSGSDVADVSHLTSNGVPVVSGTSIAGALRARALKITQSLPGGLIVDNPVEDATTPEEKAKADARNRAQILVDDLFGEHGTNDNKNRMSASRLLVEEHAIENPIFDRIQNRVKIDRFTGGAFDTALFDEQPVFAGDDTIVKINFELRLPVSELAIQDLSSEQDFVATQARVSPCVGLLLLVLKDLWTEDLPIGGESSIGRGRLRGQEATLGLKLVDGKAEYHFADGKLTSGDDTAILQTFVDDLWDYLENGV